MTKNDWAYIFWLYIFVGICTFISCSGGNGFNLPADQSAGIAILWPLFAFKYIAIGIYIGAKAICIAIGAGLEIFWS